MKNIFGQKVVPAAFQYVILARSYRAFNRHHRLKKRKYLGIILKLWLSSNKRPFILTLAQNMDLLDI